jgi:hypothetical protein
VLPISSASSGRRFSRSLSSRKSRQTFAARRRGNPLRLRANERPFYGAAYF